MISSPLQFLLKLLITFDIGPSAGHMMFQQHQFWGLFVTFTLQVQYLIHYVSVFSNVTTVPCITLSFVIQYQVILNL